LRFEATLASEDIIAASVNIFRGWGILKNQKLIQKLRKTTIKIDRNMYVFYVHFIIQASIDGLTSENGHKG
jgi:capsule polysaccharide export protein KpsC/LpsZ